MLSIVRDLSGHACTGAEPASALAWKCVMVAPRDALADTVLSRCVSMAPADDTLPVCCREGASVRCGGTTIASAGATGGPLVAAPETLPSDGGGSHTMH